MTIDKILNSFDEKYKIILVPKHHDKNLLTDVEIKTQEIRDFLRSSYSELLEELLKEVIGDIDKLPIVPSRCGLIVKDNVISIINSKLPKEDSIN